MRCFAAALFFALAFAAQAAELKIDSPANANRLVRVDLIEDDAADPIIRVRWIILGSGPGINFVDAEITNAQRRAVFTGPPGSQVGVLVFYDRASGAGDQLQTVVTIGNEVDPDTPPGPGPGPPPKPPNVPDDQFDNVGRKAAELAAKIPDAASIAPKLADIHEAAAAGLADGTYINVTEAANYVKAERAKLFTGPHAAAWFSFVDEIAKHWNKFWPFDKSTAIKFHEAVAGGLSALRPAARPIPSDDSGYRPPVRPLPFGYHSGYRPPLRNGSPTRSTAARSYSDVRADALDLLDRTKHLGTR